MKNSGVEGWWPILDGLKKRKARAKEMGGAEKLARQRALGKLDARERILRLFDPGTFYEIGILAGSIRDPGEPETPADAVVGGIGEIEGRPATAWAEDFTVLGGSIGRHGTAKRCRICELAGRYRIPIVTMLESAGHRLTEPPGYAPHDLQTLADLSGKVPMVCLIMGAAAGHSALAAPLSDFTIMTEDASMFTGGPPLVKAALGEEVTKEELGGYRVHCEESGCAHNVCPNDDQAIDMARRYLGYFPSSKWDVPPLGTGSDTGPRLLDKLLQIIPPEPNHPYDMHDVLEILVDEDSLFEVQPNFGRSVINALAFLGGQSVAIIANNPCFGAGSVDSRAAIKADAFMKTVGAFNLPVLFLADNPGVMAGKKAEREGILRWTGLMYKTVHNLRVPKLHVSMRKSFGFGAVSMAMSPFEGQTMSLAFPSFTVGAMPSKTGGSSAKYDESTQAEVDSRQASGAYVKASMMVFDDVIDPRELRNILMLKLKLARRLQYHSSRLSRDRENAEC